MFERSLLAWLLLAAAALIFLPALIIGSVGARQLTIARHQQSVFTSTTCHVSNITDEVLPIDCTCDGCQPSKCYAEHFAVRYPIANGTIVSSVIHIDEVPDLLNIQTNNNYSCFYDRTQVETVQWSKPSERPALAMLVVGFGFAGIVVVSLIVGQICWLVKDRLAGTNLHLTF